MSYSLYLLHPSMGLLSEFLLRGTDASGLLVALVATVLTLAAAHLCFRYIEHPFIQLGKRLNNRKTGPQPVSV